VSDSLTAALFSLQRVGVVLCWRVFLVVMVRLLFGGMDFVFVGGCLLVCLFFRFCCVD